MTLEEQIKNNPYLIFTMKNPPDSLIDLAISVEVGIVNHFMTNKRYDKYKIEDGTIFNLDNLSEEKLSRIVMLNPSAVLKLSNPSINLQVLAVKRKPDIIFMLDKPSIKVWRTAIGENPSYIKYLDEQVQELQLLAISISPNAIEFIKKPTKVVQRYVIKHYPEYAYKLRCVDDDICIDTIRKEGLQSIMMFPRLSDAVREAIYDMKK